MINFSGGPLQRLRQSLRGRKAPSPSDPDPSRWESEDEMLFRQRQKRRAELIQKFRPDGQSWFGLSFMFMLLTCCVLWEGIALFSVAGWDRLVPGDQWLRGALLPVVFMVGLYRGRWLAEWERTEYWTLRIVELVALIVLSRYVPYILNPAGLGAQGFIIPPLFTNAALFGWAFLSGENLAYPLLKMYVRPNEVTAEEGGSGENMAGWNDRKLSYRKLRNRLVFGGFLLGVALAVPFFIDPNHPDTNLESTTVLLLVLYMPVALWLFSWIRLRYLRTVWRLEELPEPRGLPRYWLFYLSAVGVLALLVAALVPKSTDLNLSSTFNLNFSITPNGTLPPLPTPRATPTYQQPPVPSDFLQQILDIFFFLMAVLTTGILIVALIFLIRIIKWHKFLDLPKIKLRWPSFGRFLEWLRSWFKRADWDKAEEVVHEGDSLARRRWWQRFARESLPNDPRGQVRYYYRQTLSKAARAGVPRQPPQTPKEYSGYIEPRLVEETPVQVEVDPVQDMTSLSKLYEEARFSPHPVDPAQAEQASQHASHLSTAFRKLRREKKDPKPEGRDQKAEVKDQKKDEGDEKRD